jgi:tetratricopeptide (TPR) repeat protein
MILRDPITPLDEERPDCPAALGRVVHRALELLPGHRYDSARAMEEALAEVAAHFEGDDREACASYSGRSPVERWFDPSSHVASVGPRGDEPVAAHASGTWYEKLRDGWGPSAHRWLAGGTATAICVAAVLVLSMDRAPGLSMDRERAAAQAITTLRGPATATGRPGSQSSNASSSDVTVEPGRASDSAAASPRPSLEIPRIVPAASSVGSEELAARPHERNRAERDRASRDRVSRDPAPVPGAPLDTTELRNSAFRHYARGDLADAAVLYHRAVRTDPSDARAWRGLGLSVRGLGRDEDAKRALQRYLTLAPDARDARRVQAIVDTLEGR